jgi:hypothetical protein
MVQRINQNEMIISEGKPMESKNREPLRISVTGAGIALLGVAIVFWGRDWFQDFRGCAGGGIQAHALRLYESVFPGTTARVLYVGLLCVRANAHAHSFGVKTGNVSQPRRAGREVSRDPK